MKDRIETLLATVFGAIFLGPVGGGGVRDDQPQAVQRLGAGRRRTGRLCAGRRLDHRLQPGADWGATTSASTSSTTVSRAACSGAELAVIVSLAAFGAFIAWIAFKVIGDTLQYGSTAQTPWATPLIWPQGVWYAGLVTFALVAAGLRACARRCCWRRTASTREPRFPSQEREGRAEGRARRPRPTPGRQQGEAK